MGIYSDFTTFFTLIYLKQLHLQDTCPLCYVSTPSNIRKLPITDVVLYLSTTYIYLMDKCMQVTVWLAISAGCVSVLVSLLGSWTLIRGHHQSLYKS